MTNRLDKLKIVTKPSYVVFFDKHLFSATTSREGTTWEYNRSYPSNLHIKIKPTELVVEFTAKILGVNYINLIYKDNIHECFDNINKLGICKLKTKSIIADCEVVKADVTADVCISHWQAISEWMMMHVGNHRKYIVTQFANKNITVRTNSTKNSVKLTMYDKKIQIAKSKAFLSTLSETARKKVTEYFSDKVRFELSLTSKKQILSAFKQESNSLYSILRSEVCPISDMLKEWLVDGDVAIDDVPVENIPALIMSNLHLVDIGRMTFTEYKYYCMLVVNQFDLCKIEKILRNYNGYNYKKTLEKARTLADKILNEISGDAHCYSVKEYVINMVKNAYYEPVTYDLFDINF